MGVAQVANSPCLVSNLRIPSSRFFSIKILITGIYLNIDAYGWKWLGKVILSLRLDEQYPIILESVLDLRSETTK